ncbi:MAG: hypothetical protein QM658_10560 [Gordonia sp. (in: high G+C Gram-positive bacteria)]
MPGTALVPALAYFVIDALADALQPSPPQPSHRHGTSVPGCTQFPAEWTDDVVAARTAEAVDTPGHWWQLSNRRFSYTRQPDGVWLMVLEHVVDDSDVSDDHDRSTRVVIAQFPWRYGCDDVTYIKPVQARIYNDTYRALWQSFDQLHNAEAESFRTAAEYLWTCGHTAEALLWLFEMSSAYSIGLSEDLYATLYAMAFDQVFVECPDFDAERLIAQRWWTDHRQSWGWTSRARGRTETASVPSSRLPACGVLVEGTERWLRLVLPSIHSATTSVAHTGESRQDCEIRVCIPGGSATLTIQRHEVCHPVVLDQEIPSQYVCVLTLATPTDPRDALAAHVLAIASSVALSKVDVEGFIHVNADFDESVDTDDLIRRELSLTDVRRLRPVDTQATLVDEPDQTRSPSPRLRC